MFSLKPKEGGSTHTPVTPPAANTNLLKGGIVLALVLILGVWYNASSTRSTLEGRIAVLEKQLAGQVDEVKTLKQRDVDMSADIGLVTKKVGLTAQELDASRKYAERLKAEQDKAREQLASELATKASSTDVAAVSTKVTEVQQGADTKIAGVSGEVKTVSANLDATKKDLADSRRDLTDVKTTLSAQIARNSTELADLKKKGERDYFEFDIAKPKKNELTRVADIQLQLRRTDPKKAKYDMLIQVDDSRLEKKDRTANEPVQFLVGKDKLRYEIVVNYVDKDRIRGYLSAPKDKALAAERPTAKPE